LWKTNQIILILFGMHWSHLQDSLPGIQILIWPKIPSFDISLNSPYTINLHFRINIIWFVFHKYLIHFVYDKDTTVVLRILITIREFWNLQMLPKSWIFFGWFSHGFLFVTLKTQSYINILLVHLDTWKCATWGHM
jgi:hypothetical protein